MTREEFEILKQFEERNPPLFTSASRNKNTGALSNSDIKILNSVAKTTIKAKYSNCAMCGGEKRKRFLKDMATAYFAYKIIHDGGNN